MNNKILILRDRTVVRELCLGSEAVQVGSARDCDVIIDDPTVAPRAYLIQARGGTVWLHHLDGPDRDPSVLPLDRPLRLGGYELVRRYAAKARSSEAHVTVSVPIERDRPSRWTLAVGRGGEARRVSISDQPVTVGTGHGNDVQLYDPTVSGRHCRFEPAMGYLVVRDLGSTNGTFVQGVRVDRAQVTPGMQVRIGRTDLYVLGAARGPEREARPVIAASQAMQEVVAEAQRFATLPWPVLVLGPSGAGKEEIAHLLHRASARCQGPFVALNAGGLPRELVESELFGHERGAFTGAVSQRRGAFEQAQGGTLFLDEIGELPLDLQARLLRVLETWQIRRVGAEQPIDVDVRLVCATHRDLVGMSHAGTFREDLYYRLTRLLVTITPLCERPDDILPLAEHFLAGLTREVGPRALTRDAKARLLTHSWPGNARELRNVLSTAAVMGGGADIDLCDVERALQRIHGRRLEGKLDEATLARAMEQYRGNLSAVARALSVPRSTLKDRLRKTRQAP